MVFNIPLICTVMAIIACIYASYTDLKSSIIPNKLTYSLVILGIGLNAIYAFMINNIWYIIVGLIFVALIYVISYIFWRFNAWAGGDAKLFTGLAALLPFYPNIINYIILGLSFPIVSLYGFPFTLIINSILAMLPFLLIYVLFIALRRKPHLVGELLEPVKSYKKNIVLALVTTSAITITYILWPYMPYKTIIILVILIFILSFIISRLPDIIKAVVLSVFAVYALYLNAYITVIGIITVFIFITVIEFIKTLLMSVNKKALQDDYEIKDLKEGMIPVYGLYEKENKIYTDDQTFSERVKESIDSGDPASFMKPKGNFIINTRAAGLTEGDITLLKKLSEENKIDNKLRIKRGTPFAPSILIGLLISLFIGDLAFLLQKVLYVIIY